jgi:hypothetical protein
LIEADVEPMSKQGFDPREWVNDIVTGAVTGMVGGAAGALFVPNPALADLVVGGGVVGLLTGLLTAPIRRLLNRRPEA